MKRIRYMFLFVLALFLPCLFVGCDKPEKPLPLFTYAYDIVMSTNYFVGDELELNGQKIYYYEDFLDVKNVEKDVLLTKEMVSGFSTEVVGKFKYKITYKNAFDEVEYQVFEKPNISACYGFYTSGVIGKTGENHVLEIKQNQIVIRYYENGYTGNAGEEPTSETAVSFKLKPDANGKALLIFDYDDAQYKFYDFVNGVPTRLEEKKYNGTGYNTLNASCTKIG